MRAIGTGKMQARPNRIGIDTSGFEARSTSRYDALRCKSIPKIRPTRTVSMRRLFVLPIDANSNFIAKL